jgi:hypothetical protein
MHGHKDMIEYNTTSGTELSCHQSSGLTEIYYGFENRSA